MSDDVERARQFSFPNFTRTWLFDYEKWENQRQWLDEYFTVMCGALWLAVVAAIIFVIGHSPASVMIVR